MTPTTIFSVEDDKLQLDMLEMILTRHQCRMLRATTGEDALRTFDDHPEIDLILLDVMLPGKLDGIQLCQILRSRARRSYVPIIMVTALGKADELARGLDIGADDYITKPYSSRELMARINAGLRIRHMQRDLLEAQDRYRLLVETARDLIFALDPEGRLTYASPMSEQLTGYPAQLLLADDPPFKSFIHPDDLPHLNEWRLHLATQSPDTDLEFRFTRADGELRWGGLSWAPITDQGNQLIGVQGAIRDLTHRKAVEAATWRRSQELAALNLIATRLNQSLELSGTLRDALHATLTVVDAECGVIQAVRDDRVAVQTAIGLTASDAACLPGVQTLAQWDSTEALLIHEHLEEIDGQLDMRLKVLGLQTVLTVPVRERGNLIGLLTLASRTFQKFGATEVTLISTVAEQISAAMVNARLYAQARQRADELTILYDVSRMLTSTLNLDKVLRVIMEAAASLLQVEAGAVLLLDEASGELAFAAAVGTGSEHLLHQRLPAGQGIAWQSLHEGASLLINDAARNPHVYRFIEQLAGIPTLNLIATPLRVKGRMIGVMEVINKRQGVFTSADLRVLDLLAPTAAAAIENARLYARETQLAEEVRRHNRELSALHAISAALSQSLIIQDVLEAALVVLEPQFEYDGGCLHLSDTHLDPHTAYQSPGNGLHFTVDQAPLQAINAEVQITQSVKIVPDIDELAQSESEAGHQLGLGAVVVVPLWGHQVIQGVLIMAWRQPRSFDLETTQLLAAIGQQIGVAVERAALYEVAQRRAQEIERSYAQLVQSEKLAATGRLAMSLAHEINNPLQAIQNCLHLVLEFPLDEQRRTNYLNMAREEVERLSILVQSMLDFYRPGRGTAPSAQVRVVLERMLALADQKLRNQQIQVMVDCPPDPITVPCPPDQLGQIFLNLIMNAAEAMEQGGQLKIQVRITATTIEIAFDDNGPGIPAEEMAHIFEPFYTTKDEGTGLGLAISYTLVERRGGLLTVQSTPGQGATFTIRFPAAMAPPTEN